MKHQEVSKEIIEDIREKWPKLFDNEHKPPIDGIVVSISLRDPIGNSIIKDITIMEPNGTEWNIAICDEQVMDYGITLPGPPAYLEAILNKSPVDLSHLEQWGPGPKLLKLLDKLSPEPEPEEPKKIIHRRIILD